VEQEELLGRSLQWAPHITTSDERDPEKAMQVAPRSQKKHSDKGISYNQLTGNSTRFFTKMGKNEGYGATDFTELCLSVLNPSIHLDEQVAKESQRKRSASKWM
jgi:hypothetical protein